MNSVKEHITKIQQRISADSLAFMQVVEKYLDIQSEKSRTYVILSVFGFLFSLPVLFPYYTWPIIVIILALLFVFVLNEKRKIKEIFFGGFIFGCAYFASIFLFFWQAAPLNWVGVGSSVVSLLLILLVWVITVSFYSVLVGFWAVSLKFLCSTAPLFFKLFLPATLWVSFEYLGSIAFSIIWSGPNSLIGSHFTFGTIGYSLSNSSLLSQLASIGGVYFLSFILVFLSTVLYIFCTSKNKREWKKILLLFICIFLAHSSFLFFGKNSTHVPTTELSVALFNTTSSGSYLVTPEEITERKFYETRDALTSIVQNGNRPDMVVFPEDNGFIKRLGPSALSVLDTVAVRKDTLFIDSIREVPGVGVAPSSMIITYNAESKKVNRFNKNILLPGGEYQPHIVSFFGNVIHPSWMDSVNSVRGYVNGDVPPVVTINNTNVGIAGCSEIASPSYIRSLVRGGAHILANVASHSIFGNSLLLKNQIFSMLQLRAVENGRFIVEAGDGIPSVIVGNDGKIKTIIENKHRISNVFVDFGIVSTHTTHTVYTRYGNWILTASFLFIVARLLNMSLWRPVLRVRGHVYKKVTHR